VITGLNHITIAVSDLERSLAFYIDRLGFTGHVKWHTGAYLTVGKLWVCLTVDKPSPAADYSHIAFGISATDFTLFSEAIAASDVVQWKDNSSEGQSLYILDPDGHRLEVHVGGLAERIKSLKHNPYDGMVWL
jgi:catechol 2,3-dioxygenase-like lactoylglutathione lyase family enzyme